jgi:hypothetical protein
VDACGFPMTLLNARIEARYFRSAVRRLGG